ncbi:RNA-dependent RNA polymerase [Bondarzewia berkeleyi partitivirus 1]|nr:RNA-dependent RNA polymerase [Bondarzewia berkeleyi partitivirus 1]
MQLPFFTKVKEFFYNKFNPELSEFREHYEFKHCLKYIGRTTPRHIPTRHPSQYAEYQAVVKEAIEYVYPGYVSEHVINDYHHPEATYDLILSTLIKADKPIHNVPQDEHFQLGWALTADAFRPPQPLRPVHLADMRFYRWNWYPNVEAPFSTDKKLIAAVSEAAKAGILPNAKMSFGNLKHVVFTRLRTFMHQIKRNQITDPAHRYPEVTIHVKPALTGTDKYKIRVIAGVSKLHVIPSAQRFWPLFRHWIESKDSPMLWGYETILGGMQKLHLDMTIPRLMWKTFVTIDWPAYDLQINFEERRRCYVTYEQYFDFNNGYIPTKFYPESTADPDHLHRAWDWIVEATRKMPIVLPDGSMYVMADGYWFVFSGLFQTQSDDSLINHARILTIMSSLGFEVTSSVRLKVQGDDSLTKLVFFVPPNEHDAFKEAFSKKALFYFDSDVRPEKSNIHNDPQGVECLGYQNNNGYPERDEVKLIAMLLHPRGSPTLDTLMAKCAGFAYADCYRHPRVIEVLQRIWNKLQAQGHSPGLLRTQRDVLLHGETKFEIPTDHFPSMNEVTRHLRTPYVRNLIDKEFYFPGYTRTSHFQSLF